MSTDGATGNLLDSILLWFTQQLGDAVLAMFQMTMSWWVGVSTPGLSDQGGAFVFLRERTGWLTAVMAIAGLLVAAGRVAIQRKGQPFREAFSQLLTLVIIVFTLAAAVNLINLAGDEYSRYILSQVTPPNGNWAQNWAPGLNTLNGRVSRSFSSFFGSY
jgi:hypothetical protein